MNERVPNEQANEQTNMITINTHSQRDMAVASLTGMISIEPKKGDRVNLTSPLKAFIRGAFPDLQEVIIT